MEIFIQDKKMADFFEEVASELESSQNFIQLAVNYLLTDLTSLMKEKMLAFDELLITPENFSELIELVGNNEITSRTAKDILKIMIEKGGDPSLIMEEMGLRQVSDASFADKIAEEIIKENLSVVEDFKRGKTNALQFLIGQCMKKTKGSINPDILRKSLKNNIK